MSDSNTVYRPKFLPVGTDQSERELLDKVVRIMPGQRFEICFSEEAYLQEITDLHSLFVAKQIEFVYPEELEDILVIIDTGYWPESWENRVITLEAELHWRKEAFMANILDLLRYVKFVAQ